MTGAEAVPAHEGWPCFVGSGECHAPAVWRIDDGEGGELHVCAAHAVQMEAMEAKLRGNPALCEKLRAEILAHE